MNAFPLPLRTAWLLTGFLLLAGLLSACVTDGENVTARQATVDLGLLQTLPEQPVSYENEVRPVLQRRCVVCHGCYDAPCQLKLSSPEGVSRGASKERVYNGARFTAMAPTRLGIDARTTEQWRGKGFHGVLNEGARNPVDNLDGSVMYRMLRLKQLNPQARVGMLPDTFDLSLDRKQTCPTLEEFPDYARRFPNQGMPFGLPNLEDDEYRVLVQWLAQGAPVPAGNGPSPAARESIARWERFLNGAGLKERLMSRYLYEHLFIGHMHLQGTGDREYYRLVRSSTPPGEQVDEIATLRPYDDPGGPFYYRLLRYDADIVAKTHIVYELSDERMDRYRELFLEPDYEVARLPSWDPEIAANPFKAFRDIPPRSRYQFLLDDAHYFIEGFIEGPVCRGMIALNVIEDQFWVTFIDPDMDSMLAHPEELEAMADYLQIPSAQGGKIRLLSSWKHYRKLEREYTNQRFTYYAAMEPRDIEQAMDIIWDGGGTNPNAALTVFRHYDSASVTYGFVGDYPETAWVIDYPLFERIHYLLVAGFNVFGNLKHQLNTRLYMDFLRMEGEDMFLAFIPVSHRSAIRDSWYQGMREGMDMAVGDTDIWMTHDVVTGYRTDDPQRELYRHMKRRLSGVLARDDTINRCDFPPCEPAQGNADKRRVDEAMRRIAKIRGTVVTAIPDVAFVRVRRGGDPEDDFAYTVIRNKAYKNVTSMFEDERDTAARDYSNDSVSVVDWLEGSYPNFFFTVDLDDIETFAQRYAALSDRDDYERFVGIYGTRRTSSGFWSLADWFQDASLREHPVQAGLYDLNRYQNR